MSTEIIKQRNHNEKKFIENTIVGTSIAIVVGAVVAELWFLYGPPLKLDSQSLVGLMSITVGIPVAVVGAWVAIKIATLAQNTQDKQHNLETKKFLIDLTSPIKNNFNQLAHSLNELLSAAELHYDICSEFLSPIINNENTKWVDEECKGIKHRNPLDESTLIISAEMKVRLIRSEEEIFNKFDDLLKALSEIRNDSKSSDFWEWKLLNEKNFELSRLAVQIKVHAHTIRSRELLSYLKVNKGIGALITCCKLIKKTDLINLHELQNHEILDRLKKIHLDTVRSDVTAPYKFAEGFDKTMHAIDICNSLISVKTTLAWPEYNCNEDVKLLSEILLYIITALPTERDVKSFLYSDTSPFKGIIEEEDELNKFLCDFDSSTILSIDLNELKATLSNAESYLKTYDKFNIVSKEDEMKLEYDKYLEAEALKGD